MTLPRVVFAWVDTGALTSDPAYAKGLERMSQALSGEGIALVPLTLTADCTTFCRLTATELRSIGQKATQESPLELEGGWLLVHSALGQYAPKTIAKIGRSHGMRIAVVGSFSHPDGLMDLRLAPMDDKESEWAKQGVEAMGAFAPPDRSPGGLRRPVLSICVTTYNRARWLVHSLPLILEQAAPYGDLVEVVVCDNASQDDTAQVVEKLQTKHEFSYHRNEKNVGMLGNLAVSCDQGKGQFIWVIGDDDLMVEGTLERVLSAIAMHPEVELIYTNYAHTNFDRPEDLSAIESVVRSGKAVSDRIRDCYADRLATVAANSENCFTAIYCLIFRADHAKAAYHQDVSGRPFSTLPTTAPTADYVARHMLDRPAFWIGDPCVVVNMNVSWLRYATLFILERFPELYDLMQENGVSAADVDRLRSDHVKHLPRWFEEILTPSQKENLPLFSPERLIKRFSHLQAFREQWPELLEIYRTAFRQARVGDLSLTPAKLDAMVYAGNRSGPWQKT